MKSLYMFIFHNQNRIRCYKDNY